MHQFDSDPVKMIEDFEKGIVEEGIGIKVEEDEVWFVFDMEDTQDKQEKAKEAVENLEEKGYRIALSIPSFELWFILHYRSWNHRSSNQDLMNEIKKPKLIPTYKKGMDVFPIISSRTKDAISKAKRLYDMHNKSGLSEEDLYTDKANPITHVFKLVELLESERK